MTAQAELMTLQIATMEDKPTMAIKDVTEFFIVTMDPTKRIVHVIIFVSVGYWIMGLTRKRDQFFGLGSY